MLNKLTKTKAEHLKECSARARSTSLQPKFYSDILIIISSGSDVNKHVENMRKYFFDNISKYVTRQVKNFLDYAGEKWYSDFVVAATI